MCKHEMGFFKGYLRVLRYGQNLVIVIKLNKSLLMAIVFNVLYISAQNDNILIYCNN